MHHPQLFEAGHIINININLPSEQGGMLGYLSNDILRQAIGYIGSLIFLIISFAIGFSLFTGWSWLDITEGVGNLMCNLSKAIYEKFNDWQDRREGKRLELKRDEFVVEERKKFEDRVPIEIIEPKTVIKESVRVIKEKQTNLFGDTDAELPPTSFARSTIETN